MNEKVFRSKLESVSQLLDELDDSLDQAEKLPHYIEFCGNLSDGFILGANTEGFIYLANLMISLAENRKENEHYHFDSCNMLDKNTCGLTIRFKEK